jgi:hypothetical protein
VRGVLVVVGVKSVMEQRRMSEVRR